MTQTFDALLCSDADFAVGDDQRGSAATFDGFLLIEHHTSFGREAAEDAVRAVYDTDAGVVLGIENLRPFAIRPVGRSEVDGSRVRFLGRTGARSAILEPGTTPTPADLRNLGSLAPHPAEPLFAVCTNGSRDRCCAIKGRDLGAELHRTLDDPDDAARVVEISHLGGHRFAPTMLVLPWGYAYGRLDVDSALEVAHAALDGLVHPTNLRGRADLSPAAQVADAIWRTELGPAPITAVEIIRSEFHGGLRTITALVEGAEERLHLRSTPGPVIGATACGGKPIATTGWEVTPG